MILFLLLIWLFIHIEDSDEINNLIKLNSRCLLSRIWTIWPNFDVLVIKIFIFSSLTFSIFSSSLVKNFCKSSKIDDGHIFYEKTYYLVESCGRQNCYFFISSQFHKFWKFFRVVRFDRIISEPQIIQKVEIFRFTWGPVSVNQDCKLFDSAVFLTIGRNHWDFRINGRDSSCWTYI